MTRATTIQRIHYGFLVAPAGGRDAGQPIPVSGFAVTHADGVLLFDTGFAPVDDETRRRYKPRAISVDHALDDVGLRMTDIDVVANCHLHADHAGGNERFPGVPVYVQRTEFEAANEQGYTVSSHTHDFSGARIELVDGEHEPMPGLRLVPTVGHSPGHQALVIETGTDVVVLAGQAFTTASEFGFAAFASELRRERLGAVGETPDWMERLLAFDSTRVYFAHDLLVHERVTSGFGRARPL